MLVIIALRAPVRDFGGRWLTENVFGAIGQVLGGPF